jgi:acetyl-CoA C-acetyltransferase
MHSIARGVELTRAKPGSRCLITANGGYLTKHAFGVYSSEPPAKPFQHQDVQAEVDATPSREVAMEYAGDATVEGYTVMYGADAPTIGHVVCRLADGRRTWANTTDAAVLDAMTREEFCGRPVRVADYQASF